MGLSALQRSLGGGAFAAPVGYALSADEAGDVTFADFDQDNDLDLAVSTLDSGATGIQIYANDGNAGLALLSSFASPGGSLKLGVGRFDGDAFPDIAAVDSSGTDVLVYLSTGPGTFAPPVSLPFAAEPSGVFAVDLNDDDALDLIAMRIFLDDTTPEALAVYLGNGDGTFGPPKYYGGFTPGIDVATGDVDGDGTVDIVTGALFGDEAAVLQNNSDGTFAFTGAWLASSAPAGVALLDAENDGDLDIAVCGLNPGAQSVLLLNEITPATSADADNNGVPDECEAPLGDLTGDGCVNNQDLGVLLAAYLSCVGDPRFNPDANLAEDTCINFADLGILLANYLEGCE